MPAPTAYQIDKQNLGKALFWDVQLSTDNTTSCGTCHGFPSGGTDGRPPGNGMQFGQPSLGAFGVIPQSLQNMPPTVDYGFPTVTAETRQVTPFHTPTMVGAYMNRQQLWRLNAGQVFNFVGGVFNDWSSLETQSVGPQTNSIEMAHQGLVWSPNIDGSGGRIEDKLGAAAPLATVLPGSIPPSIPAAWLSMNYDAVFDLVFAADPNPVINAAVGVTQARVAMAIATYERTLIPDGAPIDNNTMTAQEVQGFDIVSASGCFFCHSVSGSPQLVNRGTPNANGTLADPWDNLFSDGAFHDIFGPGHPRRVPGVPAGVKTTTLRNMSLRTRFFHDGLGRIVGGVPQNTIGDIVDFYDIDQNPANGGRGGIFELNGSGPNSSLTTAERNAVIAFLGNALTDPRVANATPPFDSPTLYHQILPFESTHTRPSTAAPTGWQPRMINETPTLVEKVGGPTVWKVGVSSRNGSTTQPRIPNNSIATLLVGTDDLAGGPFHLSGPVIIGSTLTNSTGYGTVHVPVPLTPPLIGLVVPSQWVVTDLIGNTGFSEAALFFVF